MTRVTPVPFRLDQSSAPKPLTESLEGKHESLTGPGSGPKRSGCETGYHPSPRSLIPFCNASSISKCALSVGTLRATRIGWCDPPNGENVRVYVYAPLGSRCVKCNAGPGRLTINNASKVKLVFSVPWIYLTQGVTLKCKDCEAFFSSHHINYVRTLHAVDQLQYRYVTSEGCNALDNSILRLLRGGMTSYAANRYVEGEMRQFYLSQRALHESRLREGLERFAPSHGSAPKFPVSMVPKPEFLCRMLLKDFEYSKPYVIREIRSILAAQSLSVDYMRGAVKQLGQYGDPGSQLFTAMTKRSLICSIVVTPDTSESHVEACFDEIGRRHDEAGVARPHTIFVDSRCCSGKELGEGAPTKKGPFGARVVLDNFHVLLRLSRTINSECPRKKAVLRDLSRSLYTPFPADILALNEARAAAGLDPKDEPTRTERGRFVRRRVADPITLENRLMAVVRAHRAVDDEQIAIAQKAGRDISKPLPPTDPAYRVINSTFLSVFRSQLTHVRNCCMSDQPVRGGDHSQPLLPYLPLNRVNYRSSGYYLQQWASLRGTSMVESGHSSIHRLLFGVRGLGRQLFDCRALWWALTWNRRKREKWGLKMPHIGLGPREASLYQELGMADDYPEWQLAPESATEVRFGWDYYNHEITDSLNEAWKTAETASTVDTAADDELSELARFEYERLDFEDEGMMSGEVPVVPDCEYNEAMTEVWEDIWLHMRPRDTVSDLLHRYNVKCHELRRQSPSIPLLAVSLREVKLYIKKKQEQHGHAFSAGCLDSRSCDVIEGLASYLESTNKEVWLESVRYARAFD
ncbi:hypothetical protein FOZ62_025622 [Perkinsus olseni]|uniref:Uncharacterized protein n=1 Tax=Perkinsus olseni TaxID=32597 RepID=A0A7J6Q8N0_PEROL|nr:hypothetical protein FOZ62_025622 [Perkinsus olseni]